MRPACGLCCTCSPCGPQSCYPPRPNTRPASCPPRPTNSRPEPSAAVVRLLQPQRQPSRARPRQPQAASRDLSGLARCVAIQPEGNRNAGLFWAANRALETDPAADLSQLADAARQAGLGDPEITRTLNSARHTSHR
ncbi:MAG TPA: hypothetical protein VMK84_18515 [Streptosporangiaceae bacterium]|nr:hypothetical protein [Streptosporangiaceae bacterium]